MALAPDEHAGGHMLADERAIASSPRLALEQEPGMAGLAIDPVELELGRRVGRCGQLLMCCWCWC